MNSTTSDLIEDARQIDLVDVVRSNSNNHNRNGCMLPISVIIERLLEKIANGS